MDNDTVSLLCAVEGDPAVFPITMAISDYVVTLQQLIYREKSRVLREWDATDLILWKVRTL